MQFSQISLIPQFRPLSFRFKENKALDKPEIEHYPAFERGYFPNFPFLYTSDCKPWNEANKYLVNSLLGMSTYGSYKATTFLNKAQDLISYERFLHSSGLDALSFPTSIFQRPTYKYRAWLIQQVQEGKLAAGSASRKINAVVNFYSGLATYNLIPEDVFEKTHTPKAVLIRSLTETGFIKKLSVKTSDLAIKVPESPSFPNTIQDGGELSPLLPDEQKILNSFLEKETDQCLKLFFQVALATGARIQTVGTLTIEAIKKAPLLAGSYRVKVGQGSDVDTKYSKPFYLNFPSFLRESLLIYAESPFAKKRRASSFYGETDKNYLFLTNRGTPYYTSLRELRDRAAKGAFRVVDKKSLSSIAVKDGSAIRMYIKETLIPKIREVEPGFRAFSFHDLRATFGMNYLTAVMSFREKYNKEHPHKALDILWVLNEVKEAMAHSSIATTEKYLNFSKATKFFDEISDIYEEEIFRKMRELS